MGPQNRDHSFSLNKKEKTLALRCALSNKINKEKIIFIDSFEIKDHKTKNLFKNLKNFNFNSALFIHNDDEKNENPYGKQNDAKGTVLTSSNYIPSCHPKKNSMISAEKK